MNTPTPNQPASTSTLRSSVLLLFGVFLSFVFPILNGFSQSYDLSRDFSRSSNPTGVWSYGYKTTLGGAFTLFGVARQATDEGGALIDIWSKNSYEDAAIYHNGSGVTGRALGTEGVYPPGTVWFLPGVAGNLDTYCVIRFKVPVGAGGNYQLITVTEPYLNGPHSGDTDFHVLHDGAELFGEFLAAKTGSSYSNTMALAEGDTVDFAVGRGRDNSNYGSGFKIKASLDLVSSAVVAPTILSGPEDMTVIVGSNSTFSVNVSGTEPLSYQWRKDGTDIDGGTGVSLALANVQGSQAGKYSVMVSNAAGSASSREAVLVVNPAAVPATYDLSRDFSRTANPNGVWSYGYKTSLGGNFILYSTTFQALDAGGALIDIWSKSDRDNSAIYHNGSSVTGMANGGQGVYPPGTVWYTGGVEGRLDNYGVIRCAVPLGGGGDYELEVVVDSFLKGPISGDTDFHVLRNGVELFGQFLVANAGTSYSNTVTLAGGDTIDFAVGRGADGRLYGSGLKIAATLDLVGTTPAAPMILVQPEDQTVIVGSNVTFSLSASGTGPLSYQWRKDGLDLDGATAPSLALANVQGSQAGKYSVLVSNAVGKVISQEATLIVDTDPRPPSLSFQPVNQTATAGGNASFSVTANGSAPLSYQWYFNGSIVVGATGNSLTFHNLQANQEGTYWVVVSNPIGTITSESAMLDVNNGLKGGTVNFGNDSQSYVYDVDGTTRLPSGSTYLAQLYAGPGPDSLRPVGGTTPIAPIAGLFTGGTRVIPTVSGGQLASVQVRVWESAKGSTYEQALGERGKTGASAILQVLTGNPNQVPPTLPTPLTGLQSFSLSIGPPATPPEITTQPQSQTVSLGAKGNLAVVASGGAPLHYQWRFNGSNLEKATAATFAVTNAQPGNAGGYTVVVSNSGGSVTSEVATVTVMIDRTLALISPPAKHEGEIVPVPIELIGKGDIGGITLLVHYDPDFLSAPEVSWGAVLDDALKLANVPVLGELRLVFAFPLGAVPEGTQSLATVNFRARTVQANATTDLNLQVIDVSNPDGSTLRFGTEVLSGQATVLARGGGGTGDNNGNNRLDVGDVTLVLRLLAQLDTIRPWDVTRNDLNGNGSIDSGDAVKILRGAAEIGNPVPPPPEAAFAKALASPPAGSAVLSPLRLGGTAGQLVTAFVRLQNLPTPISGAAFTLHYPANALRLVNAQSHRTGALVPGNALAVWNVAPSGNNYAGQSGQIRLAASSATPWASQDGILAELTFEVQAAAAGQYLWPLSLTAVEVSQNGFDNQILPTSGSSFVGREPVPGSLGTTRYTASGQFEMIFSGDAGARYAIEATTDFVAWTLLQNVLSPEGAVSIVDPNAGQFPRRFYRAKLEGN